MQHTHQVRGQLFLHHEFWESNSVRQVWGTNSYPQRHCSSLAWNFYGHHSAQRKTNQAERAFMDWLHPCSWKLLDPIFQILGTSLLFHLAASHIRTLSLENGYLAHSVVLMSASRITLWGKPVSCIHSWYNDWLHMNMLSCTRGHKALQELTINRRIPAHKASVTVDSSRSLGVVALVYDPSHMESKAGGSWIWD